MENMLGSPREDLFGITTDFIEKLKNGSITPMEAKRFLRRENPFLGPSMELANQLTRWQVIFGKAGVTCDTSKLKIPKQQPGFDRLIIVPKGLTRKQMIKIMRTKFNMWVYTDDLDEAITKNDRSNEDDTYAVWVRDNVEADEELKNLSANDIAEQKISGQTLLERLLHEWAYSDETGKHLDIENVTLCAGSRYSDGRVPSVYWYHDDRKVHVDWYDPGGSLARLRTRAVVS
ncbi:hypothetical protein H6785_04150 [Candidatus Nomurabacteria bacterium]|nr:hypothetical protein [Candidatus Nomurabacteria bacterium]